MQLCLSCARLINVEPCSSPNRNNYEHRNPDQQMVKEEITTGGDQNLLRTSKPCDPAKGEEVRTAKKPVVVVHTRAVSAGSIRMNFSKKNIRNGSNQYRQHLQRVLPRLNAFEPPEMPPRERVRQLALHLRRTYGHPSLRFALSQCNIFPVGSMVTLRTLGGVCSTDQLIPAARYVRSYRY